MSLPWKSLCLGQSDSIRDAIAKINEGCAQIALVVSADDVLQGIVTDGDIRRGILAGRTLEDPVASVMHRNFLSVTKNTQREAILNLMQIHRLHQIPVLDNGRLCGLHLLDDVVTRLTLPNAALIMAGGRGRRLGPLTDSTPKPMLNLGGKPILENIILSLIQSGISTFYISVNYLADSITRYFGDGKKWGIKIYYLRENEQLGTGGALGLIEESLEHPILVMNGDVVTDTDVRRLISFHKEQQACATLCIREYEIQVPYGVVTTEDSLLVKISEKPMHRWFVNAGIYILNPDVVHLVPKNQHMDMPDFLETLTQNKHKVAAFPIHEYWMDIGRPEDFEKVKTEAS
jgi:dTDP-glucose pyrophosphorylase